MALCRTVEIHSWPYDVIKIGFSFSGSFLSFVLIMALLFNSIYKVMCMAVVVVCVLQLCIVVALACNTHTQVPSSHCQCVITCKEA